MPANVIVGDVIARHSRSNLKNITFLGSNGNHHHALKYVNKIKKPFILILFDAHSDAKPYQKEIQCGNWVNFAIKENPNIEKVILIGVSKGMQFEDATVWNNYDLMKNGKLLLLPAKKCISYFKDTDVPFALKGLYSSYEFDNIGKFFGHPGYYITWNDYKTSLFAIRYSLYLSIDLDVLKDVKTPYGSGLLSTDDLLEVIKELKKNNKIIGVDICGTDDKSSDIAVKKIINILCSSRIYATN